MRPPRPAAAARLGPGRGRLPGRRTGAKTLAGDDQTAPGAIRYLHRAAGRPVPTDDVCVSETLAGIRREAAKKGQIPLQKVVATVTILRRLLAPISDDLRGLRDRAVLLVGFTGALRRSELAAIRFQQLEKTDRGIRLTLPQTKASRPTR